MKSVWEALFNTRENLVSYLKSLSFIGCRSAHLMTLPVAMVGKTSLDTHECSIVIVKGSLEQVKLDQQERIEQATRINDELSREGLSFRDAKLSKWGVP